MIRRGLRDVPVVRDALRTLRTANCMHFNIAMVEFFDIKANIVNNNHIELFT